MKEFPYETLKLEAEVRETYLNGIFFPAIKKQAEEGIFEEIIEKTAYRKGGAYGKGRSGLVARDFVNRMKKKAGYVGERSINGKMLPMWYFLEDPTITKFPVKESVLYLISGSGFTQSVVHVATGCLQLGIHFVAMSYTPRSHIIKCADNHIYIPKKMEEQYIPHNHLLLQLAGKHRPVDVMGNSFETGAHLTSLGIVDGIISYHKTEDKVQASETMIESISESISYVEHFNKKLDEIKEDVMLFGEVLTKADHVRMAASGEGATSLKMGMNRLAHTGFEGFERTIDFIGSDEYGPPGYADIKKDYDVIVSTSSFRSSHSIAICREASNGDAKLYLITSRSTENELQDKLDKYKIKQPELVIYLPFSLPGREERFFDLGVRHLFEYVAAAIFEYKGISKEETVWWHIQKEIE